MVLESIFKFVNIIAQPDVLHIHEIRRLTKYPGSDELILSLLSFSELQGLPIRSGPIQTGHAV